ncbi:hypothetical protein Dsin_007930 [Dipteronia sinensis]|uniref:KIB1-4 beta-propeller domain-containing protein n=1 Tax=Dipteronia sinensis TaxID=43782 RepID=A0AAE0EGZ0_9ROSI|nr:hypothetical protein Dsin_007930 [Dipteronia sinensis]
MANREKLNHDQSASPAMEKNPIPILMLPPRKGSHVRDFLDPSKGTIQQVILPFETSGKMFSSKGFLISIEQDLSVNLFNPFSCQRIKLPNLEKIEYYCPHFETYEDIDKPIYARTLTFKCVLSSSPSLASDYIMMAIHGGGGKLSYIRAGDETWTPIDTWRDIRYEDVTYYKGQFYAVNCLGMVMALNIRRDDQREVEQVAELPRLSEEFTCQFYIVESAGSLLVVKRSIRELMDNEDENSTYKTVGFKVFNVDLRANRCTEIKYLGYRVLFLGYNSSFSCASHLCDCKPNSIYFADDYCEFEEKDGGVGKDMGIYSLEDQSITFHCNVDSIHPDTPSMWVELSMV